MGAATRSDPHFKGSRCHEEINVKGQERSQGPEGVQSLGRDTLCATGLSDLNGRM